MSTKNLSYYAMLGIYSKKTLKPSDVINFVCEQVNVPRKKVMSRGRFRELTTTRQMIYNILRIEYKMNLVTIGKLFKKDHTTIINGIKRHNDDLFSDVIYKERYAELLFLLKLKQNEHGQPIPNA